jgi:magnesium chelatase family protein
VEIEKIASLQEGESSASVQARVIQARALQTERFREHPGVYCNAQMTPALLKRHCELDDGCTSLLKIAMQRFGLSARAYDRIIKLARTIADLAGEKSIKPQHIAEAIQYRSLDREGWGG